MTATTPTYREQLFGRILGLYADLGWAVPTSIEYSSITRLEDTVSVALDQAEKRGLR